MTGTGRDPLHRRGRNCYEICVGGHLGEMIRSAFPDLRVRAEDDHTILSGVFADQAALYGVLSQLEALSLELIEVRRLPPPPPGAGAAAGAAERGGHRTVGVI